MEKIEKVKIRYVGRGRYRFTNGDFRLDFAPGKEKEVAADVAETLLREQSVERRWKKDGSLAGEKHIALFEKAAAEKAAAEKVVTLEVAEAVIKQINPASGAEETRGENQ